MAARLRYAPPVDLESRRALLDALATMPDEAFSWFVAWAHEGTECPVYPADLRGFTHEESRQAIAALRAAAAAYVKAHVGR